jgi:gas vesicle protein
MAAAPVAISGPHAKEIMSKKTKYAFGVGAIIGALATIILAVRLNNELDKSFGGQLNLSEDEFED